MNLDFDDEGKLIIPSKHSVKLKPYKPRPFIQREYISESELRASVGAAAYMDVESYPNFFCCNFKINGKFLKFECGQNRSFNPFQLSWVMHNFHTVGFNSLKYDLLMTWLAYANQNTQVLKEASNKLIYQGTWKQNLEREYNFKTYHTNHVDLIEVAPLKGSLKLYMARIHAARIQELPYPDTQILTEEEIENVVQYNFNDLDGTEQLCEFMKERLLLRADISQRYNINVMSKSDAQIAEAVICKQIETIKGFYPRKSDIKAGYKFKYDKPDYIRYATPELQKLLDDALNADFIVNDFGSIDRPKAFIGRKVRIGNLDFKFGIGGLHSCEECVSYVANEEYQISDNDVTSYYPDIILNLGLYPEQLGPGFLEVYRGFKNERVEAKRQKLLTYDKGLKIFINGASGKLNSQHSRLYSPKSYIQMTLTGQLLILMLVEILTCNGLQVISGNTDGIVIYCKKSDNERLRQWISFWENETKFKTEETQYLAYYARDVNSYFALKTDKSVKVKGSYAEVGSQSGTQLDTNCETLICSDAIKALLSKGIPIEETIKNCKDFTRFVSIRNVKGGAHKNNEYLGKVIRWAYMKGEVGTINYVMTNNKVAMTDGATPIMDMPSVFPDNINYDWYIAKCYSILEEIDYIKKEKQIEFF